MNRLNQWTIYSDLALTLKLCQLRDQKRMADSLGDAHAIDFYATRLNEVEEECVARGIEVKS